MITVFAVNAVQGNGEMKMTKFEDKLEKLPIKTIQHPFGDTEYYKAVHIKTLIAQADEEFQELKEQHGNQAESILLMLEEISTLKSQLQQQALPVVPECVAEFITKIKKAHNSLRFAFNSKFNECPAEYWNEAIVWRLNNPDEFARAWLDGYQVEKPQLFYLKNKLTTSYLALDINTGYYEHWGEEIIPKLLNKQGYKSSFTQQEIDSMQTGSYEQIEVAE